jgi:serine/threonine protein phosphatase PrpC
MTAEITTVIGQLNIVGGTWRGDAPNQVAVREPKAAGAPGAGKGDLFVLTEVRGAKSDYKTLEQKLAELIRDAYYLGRGSITASLRRALQAASDLLYQRNVQVSVEERVVAGTIALVMNGEDAFVAQIGPAALFGVLGDHIQRYPAKTIWLDEALPSGATKGRESPETETETALGLRAVIEPNLYHLRVGPGDMLILADSGLAGQLPLNVVVKAVNTSNIKTAIKNLGNMAQSNNCSALALMVIEETPSTFGAFLKNAPLPGRKAAEAIPTSSEAEPVREAVAEAPSAHTSVSKRGLAADSAARAGEMIQPPTRWLGVFAKKGKPARETELEAREAEIKAFEDNPPPLRARQAERTPSPPQETYEVRQKMAQDAKVMASVAHGSNFEPPLERKRSAASRPSFDRIFRGLIFGLLLPIALLGSGVRAILNLASLGEDRHAPRVAGSQAHRQHQPPAVSWTLLRNIAIAIPLLVALIVGIIYWQKGRMREAEYQEFYTGAQNKFQQAQGVDPGTAYGLMAEAETLLVEAEKIKSGQPEIAELRQKMAEQTDVVGTVQRLYYLPQLRQYTDPGTNLKSVLVQGVELYVLDIGTDRIFHHRLDDLGEALLPDNESLLIVSRGQAVDEITVGELVAMTWMPAGGNRQTSDLVILNTAGLLEYNPSWGITTSALTRPDPVVAPVAVDSYFGNFYVLDPPASRLWRYLPTADGYSAPPESYFPADPPVDLTNATDLAIDGAVYILFKDGRISKFEAGQPVGFNVTGLDKPFSNPVSIFTAPNEAVQHIYVADAGNRRIVQLNKDGSFMRQFKPREGEPVSFANLQDIFVDEIGGRLYVLDSNNLYLGNIPNE